MDGWKELLERFCIILYMHNFACVYKQKYLAEKLQVIFQNHAHKLNVSNLSKFLFLVTSSNNYSGQLPVLMNV